MSGGFLGQRDDFKPVASLPPAPEKVLTGEEGEQTVFTCEGKLYVFDKSLASKWKERGTGELKVRRPTGGSAPPGSVSREAVHSGILLASSQGKLAARSAGERGNRHRREGPVGDAAAWEHAPDPERVPVGRYDGQHHGRRQGHHLFCY